jgi:ribosome biogenesis GTPase
MTLEALGWDPFFAGHFAAGATQGMVPGRVMSEHRGQYQVETAQGEMPARLTGRVRGQAATREHLPVVGDWLALEVLDERPPQAIVRGVLPRKSKLSRREPGSGRDEQPLAANIDTVFLTIGLDGNYRVSRIERYLTFAWSSGATPVVLLTKADLCPERAERVRQAQAVAGQAPVHALSVVTGEGLEALAQYLRPGHTLALLGSSGVGKSTLINHLHGSDAQRTQAVRAGDDKGRHTTTHREMVLFPDGGIVIDNPGMRELQLWADEEAVTDVFQEIEALAAACRFRDCQHEQEPGCAVRRALEDGTLDPARYDNYLGLKRELRFLASRQDQRARQEQREQSKRIAKWTRQREKAGTLR